jgi:hypothetical protein
VHRYADRIQFDGNYSGKLEMLPEFSKEIKVLGIIRAPEH